MFISLRKSIIVFNEWQLKSSSRSVASWYLVRMLIKLSHSMRMCFIDIEHLSQKGQLGMGLFSMRYPCVNLVWPILILWMTTSSLLWNPKVWKGDIVGMISLSLMGVSAWLWSHRCCHLFRMKFLTSGMRSVLGMRRPKFSSLVLPSLAAESAFTFPCIPTWLGTQQNLINLRYLEIRFWISSMTSTTSGLSVKW